MTRMRRAVHELPITASSMGWGATRAADSVNFAKAKKGLLGRAKQNTRPGENRSQTSFSSSIPIQFLIFLLGKET